MKILVNALSGIGDALMFSPALALLKKHLPHSQIELVVMFPAVRDIYAANPDLNEIHFIDFLSQPKIKSLKEVFALRKNRYDVSINAYPSNRKEYNIINFLIGAKKRIATRYNNYSKSNFDFLNTQLANETKDRHNVLQNYDLVKLVDNKLNENEIGNLVLNLGARHNKFFDQFVIDNNHTGIKFAGFHAGSATFKRHVNKRWAAEKFAELANKLNKQYGMKSILFGTEVELNDAIYSLSSDSSILLPKMSILKSLALMKHCKLFVSNDAALMHLAAALQIPTVAIFGYTNYNELRPWMNKHIVVRKDLECSPCFFNSPKPVQCIYSGEEEFKCIKTISVEEVFEACEKLIEEIPGDVEA